MKRYSRFTAIELILVCAIMAILMSISIPAFLSMNEKQRITAAASSVSAKLSLARAKAVSDRMYVALIFPQADSSNKLEGKGSAGEFDNFCNMASRMAQVWKKDDTTYNFVKWLPDENWEVFGDGVFIPKKDTLNFCKHGGTALVAVNEVDFSSLASGTADNVRAVIFTPGGRIVIPDNTGDVEIRFAEGFNNDGVFIPKKDSESKSTVAVLTVNSLTGRSEITYETKELTQDELKYK